MNKEKWVEEVLASVKQVQPVASNAFMATRIEAKLQQPSPVYKLPLQWVYASAAVLLVLLVMNISVLRRTATKQPSTPGVQQLIQENGWGNNDLYSMNLSNRQHE
jgi:hypothetical protein